MKPGDKIPIVLEVIEPAKDGELITTQGEPFELNNIRGNKWWAAPHGHTSLRILICDDGLTEAGETQRRAIVDLIQCGVGG